MLRRSLVTGGLCLALLGGISVQTARAQSGGTAAEAAPAAAKDSSAAELTYAQALQQAKDKDLKLLIDFSAEH